jgi:hypothetical protein
LTGAEEDIRRGAVRAGEAMREIKMRLAYNVDVDTVRGTNRALFVRNVMTGLVTRYKESRYHA